MHSTGRVKMLVAYHNTITSCIVNYSFEMQLSFELCNTSYEAIMLK